MCPLVGYEPDPSVLGQPFFVMGFVEGVIPADVPRYSEAGFLVDEATPEQRERMVRTGLEAMATVHAIDWRSAGLEWLDASGTGNPTQAVQLDLYRRFVTEQLAGRLHPVMFAVLDWLEANDPHDERVGLIWGDTRLGNVIWQRLRAGRRLRLGGVRARPDRGRHRLVADVRPDVVRRPRCRRGWRASRPASG